ncbi:MAG: hypothetical protein ACLP0J_20830 [Solirubrobacteraceae bacterium]
MSHALQVELLWWEGCPSTEHARELLQGAVVELELGGAEIRMVEVCTEAQAQSLGFRGSPTILIDGADLAELTASGRAAPAGEPAPAALGCRAYRRRDGRISPLPDREDVREALLHAAQLRTRAVTGSVA